MSQLVTWSIFQPLTLIISQPCLFIVKFKLVQFDAMDNLTFRYLKYSSRPELILS